MQGMRENGYVTYLILKYTPYGKRTRQAKGEEETEEGEACSKEVVETKAAAGIFPPPLSFSTQFYETH
jgi:hypothetical protein